MLFEEPNSARVEVDVSNILLVILTLLQKVVSVEFEALLSKERKKLGAQFFFKRLV